MWPTFLQVSNIFADSEKSDTSVPHYTSLYRRDKLIPDFLCKVRTVFGAISTMDQKCVSVFCCTASPSADTDRVSMMVIDLRALFQAGGGVNQVRHD